MLCSVLGTGFFFSPTLHQFLLLGLAGMLPSPTILPKPDSIARASVLREVFYNYNSHWYFPSLNFYCLFLTLLFIFFFEYKIRYGKQRIYKVYKTDVIWHTYTPMKPSPQSREWTFPSSPKVSLYPSVIPPFLTPSPVPRQPLICFQSPKNFKKCHTCLFFICYKIIFALNTQLSCKDMQKIRDKVLYVYPYIRCISLLVYQLYIAA